MVLTGINLTLASKPAQEKLPSYNNILLCTALCMLWKYLHRSSNQFPFPAIAMSLFARLYLYQETLLSCWIFYQNQENSQVVPWMIIPLYCSDSYCRGETWGGANNHFVDVLWLLSLICQGTWSKDPKPARVSRFPGPGQWGILRWTSLRTFCTLNECHELSKVSHTQSETCYEAHYCMLNYSTSFTLLRFYVVCG